MARQDPLALLREREIDLIEGVKARQKILMDWFFNATLKESVFSCFECDFSPFAEYLPFSL